MTVSSEFFRNRAQACALVAVAATLLLCAAPAHADPILSRDINTYVLFAYDELVWKGGHDDTGFIFGGNIGVNAGSGITLDFATSGQGIMSPGTQAAANTVRADNAGAVFDTLFANSVTASFAATLANPNPGTPDGNWPYAGPIIAAADLPVFPFVPGRALTNGASDITVGGPANLPSPQTFLPGPYRDMDFNDNTVINFGSGVYDIRDMKMGKNVTINVTDGTILRIDERFDPNDNMNFGTNPGYGGGAKVYVGGLGDNPSTTRSISFSHGGEFHMQLFAPNSWLDIGGDSELYGRYWAFRITGDPNNNVHMVVPEPATWLLAAAGFLALVARRWRRRATR